MSEEELKALDKEAKKAKRIASEWASQLHDLVEDRLPAAYRDLPEIAQATFDACKRWEEANQRFLEASKA